MEPAFRCWVILSATVLLSYIAWRLAQPASAREAARYGWRFRDPVTADVLDGDSGVTITLSGTVAYDLPESGAQVTFEERLNGEPVGAGLPAVVREHGTGELHFRDVVVLQRPVNYPLAFSRTAFTSVDGHVVCLSRLALTAEEPATGTVPVRLATTYPARPAPPAAEPRPEPAAPRLH